MSRDRSSHGKLDPGRQGASSKAPKDVSDSRSRDSGKPRGGRRRQHTSNDHRDATARGDSSPGEAGRSHTASDADSASAASPQLRPASGSRRGNAGSVRSCSASSTALAFGSAATTPDPPVIIQLNVQNDGTVRLGDAATGKGGSGLGGTSGSGKSGTGVGGNDTDGVIGDNNSCGVAAQGRTERTSDSSASGSRRNSGSIERGALLSGKLGSGKFGSGSVAHDSRVGGNSGAVASCGVGDNGIYSSGGGEGSAAIGDSGTTGARLWDLRSLDDMQDAGSGSTRLLQQHSQARSGGEAQPGHFLQEGGRGQQGAEDGTWDPRSEAAQQPYSADASNPGIQSIIFQFSQSPCAYFSLPPVDQPPAVGRHRCFVQSRGALNDTSR